MLDKNSQLSQSEDSIDKNKDKRARWNHCAVGNVVRERIDKNGEVKHGTKEFVGGAKVYLQGKYWNKRDKKIRVIGLDRNHKYREVKVPVDCIENVRISTVYKQVVVDMMNYYEDEDLWWHRTANDKRDVKRFIELWNKKFDKNNPYEQRNIMSAGLKSLDFPEFLVQQLTEEKDRLTDEEKEEIAERINTALYFNEEESPVVFFYPSMESVDDQEDYEGEPEHIIRITWLLFTELYLFLDCAGGNFDEYDDLSIPMEQWCDALDYWEVFITAQDFDEAFEKLAGVEYDRGKVQNKEVANFLGRCGKSLWENREVSQPVWTVLSKWTALYKDSYMYINTFGW